VNRDARRISLGLKQALGDPWAEVPRRFPVGSVIEGPVVRLMKFGAFVQLTEGVEGLVHVSEISAEKHINHPQDVLRVGQVVKAQVLGIDTDKCQIKLSIKQLVPTSIDEYLAEHAEGDVVSGRILEQKSEHSLEQSSGLTIVELGEGVHATCRMAASTPAELEHKSEAKVDLSSLTSMLQARWKGGAPSTATKHETLQAGQVRSFRIVNLDREAAKIEVEVA
jgi:small subunit ribosomal protein S1